MRTSLSSSNRRRDHRGVGAGARVGRRGRRRFFRLRPANPRIEYCHTIHPAAIPITPPPCSFFARDRQLARVGTTPACGRARIKRLMFTSPPATSMVVVRDCGTSIRPAPFGIKIVVARRTDQGGIKAPAARSESTPRMRAGSTFHSRKSFHRFSRDAGHTPPASKARTTRPGVSSSPPARPD